MRTKQSKCPGKHAILIAIALLNLVILACEHQPTTTPRATASDALEGLQKNIENGAYQDNPKAKYLLTNYGKAIEELRDGQGVVPVMMVAAVVSTSRSETTITIQWLEEGLSVNGIVLEMEDGRRFEIRDLLSWTSGERQFSAPNAFKTTGFPIGGNDAKGYMDRRWDSVDLSAYRTKQISRISVICEDGSQSGLTKAFHEESE